MPIELSLPVTRSAVFDLSNHSFLSHGEKVLPIAAGYPERVVVPLALRPWQREFSDYQPVFYESPRLLEMDRTLTEGGWADPAGISREEFILLKKAGALISHEGPVQLDPETGRPLNPAGRTGIAGRGLLGKWGANQSADALLTRINSESGKLEALFIQRECGKWAIPGGMLDHGEDALTAALRELSEEAEVDPGHSEGRLIFQGMGDGPRTTDNAWIETTLYHFHLEADDPAASSEPVAGDGVCDAEWTPVTAELIESLYANHGELLAMALSQFRVSQKSLSDTVIAQLDQVQHAPTLTSFSQLHGKIGVIGGTYDLVHVGQLYAGMAAKRECHLDALVFIPAAQNPLKLNAPEAVPLERFDMLCKAVAETRDVFVSPIEIRKTGPSYTVDTVREIRKELPADSELFLIIGEDCLAQLPKWHQIDQLREMASFIPVGRAGNKELSREELVSLLGEEFVASSIEERVAGLGLDISATDLRNRLRRGEDTGNAIPPAVLSYINQRQLYHHEQVH